MILMFWYLAAIVASLAGGAMVAVTRCMMLQHGMIALSLRIWYT
jgi:hypothetical protein